MTTITITITEVPLRDGRTLVMKQPLVFEVHEWLAEVRYCAMNSDLDIMACGNTDEELVKDAEETVAAEFHIYEALAARWREVAEVREAPMTREEQYAWEAVQRDLDRDLMNRADREADNDP